MITRDDGLVKSPAGERKSLTSINTSYLNPESRKGKVNKRHNTLRFIGVFSTSVRYHDAYGGYHEYIEECSVYQGTP